MSVARFYYTSNEQDLVAKWMSAKLSANGLGATLSGSPGLPPAQLRLDRGRLVLEEATELLIGLQEGDLVKIADACADLQYVTLGTACACGIDLAPIFREVHRSNMTKGIMDQHGKGGKSVAGFSRADVAGLLTAQLRARGGR